MKEQFKSDTVRTLGRSLARPMSEEEISLVSGADGQSTEDNQQSWSHGDDDHSQTGMPCTDCD
jgi:hypothetical protein